MKTKDLKLGVRAFVATIGCLLLTQMYQNCGQFRRSQLLDQTGYLDQSSSILPDTSHPSVKSVDPPVQHVLVQSKVYVAGLMRDIFTSTATPVPNLEDLINRWIMYRPAQYGGSCNTYDTYSQRDCGGDVSNVNLPMTTDNNTIRESFRLQFCDNILGYDQAVSAVMEKINRAAQAPPSVDSISQIYALFYRGQDANEVTVNSLVELDRSLAQNSEPVLERWRALILEVCESPGWQLQ